MAIDFESLKTRATYGAHEYLSMLRRLLPRGPIWGFDQYEEGEVFQDTLPSSAEEFQDSVFVSGDFLQDAVAGAVTISASALGLFFSVVGEELARIEARAYVLLQEAIAGVSVELLPDWEKEAGLIGAGQLQTHARLYNENQTVTAEYLTEYADLIGWEIIVIEGGTDTEPFITGVARTGITRLGGFRVSNILTIQIISGTGDVEAFKAILTKLIPAHVVVVWEDLR